MQQNCHKIKTFAPAIFLGMSSNMLDKKAIDKTNAFSKVAFYTAVQKAFGHIRKFEGRLCKTFRKDGLSPFSLNEPNSYFPLIFKNIVCVLKPLGCAKELGRDYLIRLL